MNKTKLSSRTNSSIMMMVMLSAMLVGASSFLLIPEKNVAEATICFDCPEEANKHLDEAKKSIDSGDTEGAKKHIDIAQGILNNSTNK
jgi:hypothetical protein